MQLYLSQPALINSAGLNSQEVFKAILEKKSALKKIDNFYENQAFILGKIAEDIEKISPKFKREFKNRTNQLLFLAFLQIEKEISQAIKKFGKDRIAVVIGTTVAGVEQNFPAFKNYVLSGEFKNYDLEQNSHANPANFLADFLGLKNIAWGISSACTSGNKAIIEAARLIKNGICDAVICGGCDALDTLTVLGFDSLGVLSSERLNPFSKNRCGTNLGEGAGLFLLSREEIAEIQLLSYASNVDAFHITQPNPEAKMQIVAIKQALERANLDTVDYINLHGTGTLANDAMEAKAISETLKNTPASSSKPIFGHLLAAAGAVELGLCYLALKENVLLPHFYDNEDIEPKINLIKETKTQKIKSAMNLSFAFGGDNAVSIIGTQ